MSSSKFLKLILKRDEDGNVKPDIELIDNFRIIAVIDIDCFECQVYQRNHPGSIGKPCVVADSTGRIVSATYEAKNLGIGRHLRVSEAKKIWPHLYIITKPQVWNKPDSTGTRFASYAIRDSILQYIAFNDNDNDITIEHLPNDQCYLDLSEYIVKMIKNCTRSNKNEFTVYVPILNRRWEKVYLEDLETVKNYGVLNGAKENAFCLSRCDTFLEGDVLAVGAAIMEDIADFIYCETSFVSSVGVAKNLLRAKLACNYNKPDKITILTEDGFDRIIHKIPFRKLPGLRGVLGDKVSKNFPGMEMTCELQKVTMENFKKFLTDKEANKVYVTGQGQCDQVIKTRIFSNVVSTGRNNLEIDSYQSLHEVTEQLCLELLYRLKEEVKINLRMLDENSVKVTVVVTQTMDKTESHTFSVHFSWTSEILIHNCYVALLDSAERFDINNVIITKIKLTVNKFLNIKVKQTETCEKDLIRNVIFRRFR